MTLVTRALRGALVVSLLTTLAVPLAAAAPAHAVAPTGTTTLLTPAEGEAVGGDPVFSWEPVAGAAKYKVQVSRSDLFTSTVFSLDTVNTYATPPTTLPTGPLFWRVAPTDGTSTGIGTYVTGSFTRDWASAPVLSSPESGATLTYPGDPLLFTWQPLTGAQKYNVQIDDDMEFINPLHTASTNTTAFTLTDPLTNGQDFFWRVQAVSGTVVSAWSETRQYHVQWPSAPVLVAPTAGETLRDVELEWTPVPGAATYQLQISPNEAFTNNITTDAIVKNNRYSPPRSLTNGSYYWRVRARDGKTAPNLGVWSAKVGDAAAFFNRSWADRPTLLTPADLDFDVTSPTLSWTPVPYASHYEIELSTDVNFSTAVTKKCLTNQTSFTPYSTVVTGSLPTPPSCSITQATMPVGVQLYWKVRAVDAPASPVVYSSFSDPFSFMFKHDNVPVVLGPDHGATVANPQMTWEPVLGVARYSVSVTRNGSHITGSPFETYGTSFTLPKPVAGYTYSWRVQSVDDQGRKGYLPFGTRTFTYVPVQPTETVVQLLGPDDDSASTLMPWMTWLPVANVDEYEVFYKQAGSSAPYVSLGRTESTSFTYAGLPLSAGRYEWVVQPWDAQGVGFGRSDTRVFEVGNLAMVSGLLPAKCVESACASPETPRLSWDRVMYASGYQVVLAADPQFTTQLRTYRTQHASLTPRESLLDRKAGEAYYWFVLPCRDTAGSAGCGRLDYSTAGAYQKASPEVELTGPAWGTVVPAAESDTVEPVTFRWTEYTGTNTALDPPAAQGARLYRLQVSTDADFKAVVHEDLVDGTTYTPVTLTYPEGPLFWRVMAVDGSENDLTWSDPGFVLKSTSPLTTLHPAPDSVVSTTPYFRWTPQAHAKAYELEVYRNGDKFWSVSNKQALTSSASTVTTRVAAFAPLVAMPPGTYAWRVRRLDADNRPGTWTAGDLFTLQTGVPALTGPADATKINGNSMLFSWLPVPGAAKYRFEVSTSSAFSTIIEQPYTLSTSWAPSGTPKYPDGTLYWRVKAIDTEGATISASEVRSLVKDATRPTVTAKSPTTGALLTGQQFAVTFSEPVVGVSGTTFGLKTSAGTVVSGTVTPGPATATTSATFVATDALVPGETYTAFLSDVITDVNGNALVPVTWTSRTMLTVDANLAPVQHFWDRDTSTLASGGGYLASRTLGSKVSYTFTGTSASILGRRSTDGGYANVYVDGVKKATASFYASSTKHKQVVWSVTGLTDAKHTVELRVTATRPTGATSSWVYPDAFRYGTTTLEETSTAVVQSFRGVTLTGARGGAYALATHTASGDTGAQPYLQLKFKGSGVTWKGFRSAYGGVAKVYVDGVQRATIDTKGTANSTPSSILTVTGLSSSTTHTLKIVVTGVKSSTSKGYDVAFDSFVVV